MLKYLMSIFISIVTFNSEAYIEPCLESVFALAGIEKSQILIIDNASSDRTREILNRYQQNKSVEVIFNNNNLGFCAAQNMGASLFLNSPQDYFLMLNPDVVLDETCLIKMVDTFKLSASIGLVTPRLLRGDSKLKPVFPQIIDATGMKLLSSWRHLDRGSEQLADNNYTESEYVFGGTGACLMLSRKFISDVVIDSRAFDSAIFKVHPELEAGMSERVQLLDEAFFAFREDAELAFRANYLGWKTVYQSEAVAVHKRSVLPENRGSLPAFINRLGVRNRFLLQILHFRISQGFLPCFFGLILRNSLVVLAALFIERSSLKAFEDLQILFRRALFRRRLIIKKSKPLSSDFEWFKIDSKNINET
ncbi:MAG: glycosyltransferase [Bdellovibrionota bacterium]